MTIQDLGSIGELVAALATVATLAYLAIQIRQNTLQLEQSTLAGRAAAYHQANEQSWLAVIAVAQEDKDLESHGKFLKNFKTPPPFDIVADLDRQATARYDRTTAYLIDKQGVVRQVFPMLIHHRASWQAILHEVDRLTGGS